MVRRQRWNVWKYGVSLSTFSSKWQRIRMAIYWCHINIFKYRSRYDILFYISLYFQYFTPVISYHMLRRPLVVFIFYLCLNSYFLFIKHYSGIRDMPALSAFIISHFVFCPRKWIANREIIDPLEGKLLVLIGIDMISILIFANITISSSENSAAGKWCEL